MHDAPRERNKKDKGRKDYITIDRGRWKRAHDGHQR